MFDRVWVIGFAFDELLNFVIDGKRHGKTNTFSKSGGGAVEPEE